MGCNLKTYHCEPVSFKGTYSEVNRPTGCGVGLLHECPCFGKGLPLHDWFVLQTS